MKQSINNFWLFVILAIVAFLVWYFKTILIFLAVSGVIALMLSPLVKLIRSIRIKKFRPPPWLASLLSLMTLIGALIGFFIFIIPLVLQEARAISNIQPRQILNYFEEPLERLENYLSSFQININTQEIFTNYLQDSIMSVLDISNITGFFNIFIGLTADVFIGIFSVFFISFFFLKDRKLFPSIVLSITPANDQRKIIRIMSSVEYLLTRYFLGLLIQIFLIALFATLGLMIIGVENPLLIGVLAGVTNIVPYLGPIIGVMFGLIFGVLGNMDMNFYSELLPLILQIIIVFIIVQQLDNNIFQPVIYSTSVKAHPLEIFIVILMSARIAGIPGMIIAIPAYTVIRLIAKEFLTEFKIVQKLTRNL